MPAFFLNSRQVWTLIKMAGIREPVKGSPLDFLADKHELHPDDPSLQALRDNHLIENDKIGPRVNKLFAYALETCVRPEEVISIGIGKPEYPGYSLARKAAFWCECTVNRAGTTKFSFPLSRSTILVSLISAFSSKSPEPEPSGFRFIGSAEEAFVLSVALKEFREYPVALTSESLIKAVSKAASIPVMTAPFVVLAGAEAIQRLRQSESTVDSVINKLSLAGHLRPNGRKIIPSKSAKLALSSFPVASFGIARTEITDSGAASESMQILKVGERKLVFRLHDNKRSAPLFEWVEMNRRQIRLMISAMFLPSQQLVKNTASLAALKPEPRIVRPVSMPSLSPAQMPPVVLAGTSTSMRPAPINMPKPATDTGLCQSCGATLVAGFLFCGQCGSAVKKSTIIVKPVAAYCRKCGSQLSQQAAFCNKCGASRR